MRFQLLCQWAAIFWKKHRHLTKGGFAFSRIGIAWVEYKIDSTNTDMSSQIECYALQRFSLLYGIRRVSSVVHDSRDIYINIYIYI